MFGRFKNKSKTVVKKNAVLLGSRQRRLLSDTTHIEDELIPGFVKPMLLWVAVGVVLFFLWAGLTQITEVARTPGEIVTVGKPKVVQHFDGGMVKEILVKERELVQEGRELLRFDGTQSFANLNQSETRLVALRLRAERLEAFAVGREPNFAALAKSHDELMRDQQLLYRTQMVTLNSTTSILDKQIEQQHRRIEQHQALLTTSKDQQNLTQELTDMRENLASRRLVTRSVLLETRRAKIAAVGEVARIKQDLAVAQQELAELEFRRADTINQLRREAQVEMGTVTAEIAEVEESIVALNARVNRLVVRAPHRGYVHEMKVITIGQVFQPGALLMTIVPDDVPLEATIRIQPRDIGHVKVNQVVNLRVTSYDYSRFGFATGILSQVAASSTLDENNKPYYSGTVTLDHPFVGKTPGRNMLQSGMDVEAEIITGNKTLLSYLTKPVIDVVTRSFHER